MSPLFSLPREVVMAKESSATVEYFVEDVAGRNVEWQRDEVLNDHEVGILHVSRHVVERRRGRCPDGEFAHDHVSAAFTGERRDVMTELLKGVDPLRGFNAHAVVATQSETHDNEVGHTSRVGQVVSFSPSSRVVQGSDPSSMPWQWRNFGGSTRVDYRNHGPRWFLLG